MLPRMTSTDFGSTTLPPSSSHTEIEEPALVVMSGGVKPTRVVMRELRSWTTCAGASGGVVSADSRALERQDAAAMASNNKVIRFIGVTVPQ
jgi:hypothetical protein